MIPMQDFGVNSKNKPMKEIFSRNKELLSENRKLEETVKMLILKIKHLFKNQGFRAEVNLARKRMI